MAESDSNFLLEHDPKNPFPLFGIMHLADQTNVDIENE